MTMRPILLVLGAGLLTAAWLTPSWNRTPADPIVRPVAGTRSVPARTAFASSLPQAVAPGPVILALQPRAVLIGETSTARNGLFDSQTWTPAPPSPPKPLPPPPPMAPPMPYVYLGKKIEDGIWEAYLARGNQTFIVREQTVIESSYRVDSIRPPNLSLTYLPLNQVQSLIIGGTE